MREGVTRSLAAAALPCALGDRKVFPQMHSVGSERDYPALRSWTRSASGFLLGVGPGGTPRKAVVELQFELCLFIRTVIRIRSPG